VDDPAARPPAQSAAIEAAANEHAVVVCDTTALMTAVYSALLFEDHSLVDGAVAWQSRCAITLLTALDLPWVADGLQRDGPQVQAPVDLLLRDLLIGHRLPWALVGGSGAARVEIALDPTPPPVYYKQIRAHHTM
jgi:nicotinamide riboside kinase